MGNIAVDGRDSRLDDGQALYVGQSGEGKVEVTDGASMTSNVAHIRKGVVEVSGAGSSWTNNRNLAIGDIGPGMLRILDGGQVNAITGAVAIGNTNRALGSGHREVLVSGAGSRFSISGSSASLGVVTWGYGSLTVDNGGPQNSTLHQVRVMTPVVASWLPVPVRAGRATTFLFERTARGTSKSPTAQQQRYAASLASIRMRMDPGRYAWVKMPY